MVIDMEVNVWWFLGLKSYIDYRMLIVILVSYVEIDLKRFKKLFYGK